MYVEISGFAADKRQAVKNACGEEWPFYEADWEFYNGTLSCSADSSLCGGESEDEFARRLTEAIWKANGGFCKVSVTATCMEDLPHETYELGEDDYAKMLVAV